MGTEGKKCCLDMNKSTLKVTAVSSTLQDGLDKRPHYPLHTCERSTFTRPLASAYKATLDLHATKQQTKSQNLAEQNCHMVINFMAIHRLSADDGHVSPHPAPPPLPLFP
jgi:hypothetical protein